MASFDFWLSAFKYLNIFIYENIIVNAYINNIKASAFVIFIST